MDLGCFGIKSTHLQLFTSEEEYGELIEDHGGSEFEVCEPGPYTFSFCSDGAAADFDTVLCLFDSNERLISTNDDHCGQLSEVTADLEPGSYSLGVSANGESGGDYTLVFSTEVPNLCRGTCGPRTPVPGPPISPARARAP